MKKILLSCLFACHLLGASFALENINENTQGAIGYGWDGFEYKTYSNDAFMQYTLAMFAYIQQTGNYDYDAGGYTTDNKGEYHFALGVYRGHYLYKKPHEEDSVNSAVKIRYGGKIGALSGEYDFAFSNQSGAYLGVSVGVGVELLSPLEKGLGVEIYIEQEVSIDHNQQYLIASGLHFSTFFNY